MQLRRFRGRELPEVMRRVRDELGPDAVILHTRTAGRSGVLRFMGGVGVEVLAAVDTPGGPAATSPGPAAGPPPSTEPPSQTRRALAPPRPRGLEAGLAELRDLVVRLGGARVLPPELGPLYSRLVGAGVDESLTWAILAALPRVDAAGRLLVGAALTAALAERLTAMIRVAAPRGAERRGVVAMVGPTGSGKTTALAKLAARARVAGIPLALVSLDDGGLGAPSPLEAFARILQVPYTFAPAREDLARVVGTGGREHALFVDTPGVAPGDAAALAALRALLDVAAPTDLHLVLPATGKLADAQTAIQAFGALGETTLVWTRLDETCRHGEVLSASVDGGRPLAWFGTGRAVPGDLRPATARDLVDRVLGEEGP